MKNRGEKHKRERGRKKGGGRGSTEPTQLLIYILYYSYSFSEYFAFLRSQHTQMCIPFKFFLYNIMAL